MAESSVRYRKCSECSEDCRCGCQNEPGQRSRSHSSRSHSSKSQSVIFSLPLEILEHILQYQDPLTLLSIERTSKFLFAVVAHFWNIYCKQRRLYKKPTPLCLGWDVSEANVNSYDRAVQVSTEQEERWRIAAVRNYLRNNQQCVVCRANCENLLDGERFIFGDDVLLCPRCLPHFTITITHDLVHLFDSIGIDTNKLHVSLGTILLSQFIKALRSNKQDEKEVLEQLRPYLNNDLASPLATRRSTLMELAVPFAAGIRGSASQRDLCMILNTQQRCCCSVKQCSTAVEQMRNRHLSPRSLNLSRDKARERPFYIVLWVFIMVNLVEMLFATVLMKYYKVVNIAHEQTVPFVMLAFVEIALLFFCTCYLIVNWYRRFNKRGWNQSFPTILQCFLLSCFLVEIYEVVLTKSYIKEFDGSMNKFLQNGIDRYSENNLLRSKIDWTQTQFGCCGYSGNVTHDWFNFTQSMPVIGQLPSSCCSSIQSRCVIQNGNFKPCPISIAEGLLPVLNAFSCTTIFCSVFHLLFMVYLCLIFYVFRTQEQGRSLSPSVQTIFTIS